MQSAGIERRIVGWRSEKAEAEGGEASQNQGFVFQANVAAPYLTWTVETRTYLFLLGVVLPCLLCTQVAYMAVVFAIPAIKCWLVLAFMLPCIVSTACVAVCCLTPSFGFNRWLSSGLILGLAIWTPISVPLFFATGMFAVFVSMLLSGTLFVVCKVLMPLYLKHSRFTLWQLMWLMTLVAVAVSATSAIAQAVGGHWALFMYANYGIAIGTPGATLMTLAVMIYDYSDARRNRVGPSNLEGLSDGAPVGCFNDADGAEVVEQIWAGSTNASVADRLESRAKE